MSEKFVYHGSPREFDGDTAEPRPNLRINEQGTVVFDEESFHATPNKWIALAYTYKPQPIPNLEGEDAYYSMGVNLDSDDKEVAIFGVGSLEESLAKLYSEGGFIYSFDDQSFFFKEGLGNQEVITKSPTKPLHTEKVEDPVGEMVRLGVTFKFFDVSKQT